MKKKCKLILLIVSALFLLGICCTGCTFGKAAKINADKLYTFTGDIKYGKLNFKSLITRNAKGEWTFLFSEPEVINGVSITYKNDTVKLMYDNLEMTVTAKDMPYKSLVMGIAKILDNAATDKGLSFSKKGNNTIIEGKQDGNSYSLKVNSKTGNFLELDCEKSDLHVVITDFKENDKK